MNTQHSAEQMLSTAEDTLTAAVAEAVRAEHVAELLAQSGLAYGDLGDGTHYVALDGAHLGYARRIGEGASPLLHWFAYPLDGTATTGPWLTARQAAAALMRQHLDTAPAGSNARPLDTQADTVET